MKNKTINEDKTQFNPDKFVSKSLSKAPSNNTKNKRGCQTVIFKKAPTIIGNYSTVGNKEGKGPCSQYFHYILKNDMFGEKSYEKAERRIMEHTIFNAIDSAKLNPEDVDALICGDLLNQIISSSFAARHFNTTFIGLYGACSTMAESLAIGACLINAEYFHNVACATSSHFSTAERQYRFPLELGNQRTPTSQWTVTGSGCTILSSEGDGPKITCATFGKVTDFGIKDANNMGAAMAPAIAIIGLCGMILPRISNTKIYSKGGKYSINNVCEIQVGSQQNILLTFYYRIKNTNHLTQITSCVILYISI